MARAFVENKVCVKDVVKIKKHGNYPLQFLDCLFPPLPKGKYYPCGSLLIKAASNLNCFHYMACTLIIYMRSTKEIKGKYLVEALNFSYILERRVALPRKTYISHRSIVIDTDFSSCI